MVRPAINIVWLKRDLRLKDHAPFQKAVSDGLPVLVAYWFEPTLMQAAQTDERHWRFVYQSLEYMRKRLRRHHVPIYVFHNEVLPCLEILSNHYEVINVYSHQETGIQLTYERDKSILRFCDNNAIYWQELPKDGVIRGLKNRDDWEAQYQEYLEEPLIKVHYQAMQSVQLPRELMRQLQGLPLSPRVTTPDPNFQPGGERFAWRYLRSFVEERAAFYGWQLSKPEGSRRYCSRLSPYIAYGNLSVRQVFKHVSRARKESSFERMLDFFLERLWWRSHYMQKLESQYQIEFEPMNRGLFQLKREERMDWFNAWKSGRTGFPIVDASMRCLVKTGYLNFRMRAMLTTFATFTLWLNWRMVSNHLARNFLDFEPGIHYGQMQMQAGLTGYHPLRIYNPIIQGGQHDENGIFIKRWLPELRKVPVPLLYEPWKMTSMEQEMYNCRIGVDYPAPIVNYEEATRAAKNKYWKYRQRQEVKEDLLRIWELHCLPSNKEKYQQEFFGKKKAT